MPISPHPNLSPSQRRHVLLREATRSAARRTCSAARRTCSGSLWMWFHLLSRASFGRNAKRCPFRLQSAQADFASRDRGHDALRSQPSRAHLVGVGAQMRRKLCSKIRDISSKAIIGPLMGPVEKEPVPPLETPATAPPLPAAPNLARQKRYKIP